MFMLGHRGDRSTQINFHALRDLEDCSLTAARYRLSHVLDTNPRLVSCFQTKFSCSRDDSRSVEFVLE